MTLTIGMKRMANDIPVTDILQSEEDLQWARDVFGLTGRIGSALIVGDESAPDQVWTSEHPEPLLSTMFTLAFVAPDTCEHCNECGNALPEYYPDSRCDRCQSGH